MPVIPIERSRSEEGPDLPVVEIETPLPLASLADPELDAAAVGDGKKTSWANRIWIGSATLLIPVLAYLGAVGAAHKIGDDLAFPSGIRTVWTVPWAGVSASILEREYADHTWSPEAASWAPAARLVAMPAYQSALANALSEHTQLAARQAAGVNQAFDTDLQAAARLLAGAPGRDQLRAAREAFISFDGRARRRSVTTILLPSQLAERLDLTRDWATASAEELSQAAAAADRAPFDAEATRAVYRAKARAYIAHRLISSMDHPYESDAHGARAAALAALERASAFSPLRVINGAADGWPFGSHTAAMAGLMSDVERRLNDYSDGVRRLDRISAPVAGELAAKAP